MEPLENAIGYLGANRETLEGLRAHLTFQNKNRIDHERQMTMEKIL